MPVTYYCGENILVKASADEGVSWVTRSYSPGSPGILYDIMAWPNQPDKVTTVGNLGLIQTSIDQGVTWTNASPVSGMDVTFEEVWNIDATTSVVIGWRNLGFSTIPVFYKSIDGGLTYNQFNIRDNTNLFVDIFKKGKGKSIHFLTDQIGVIGIMGTTDTLIGYPIPTIIDCLYVLITLDGGVTWEVTNTKNPVYATSTAIPWGIKMSYNAATYIINVIGYVNGYRTTDGGVTWINYSIKTGQHLTWIGDSNLWYTEKNGYTINESFNVGSSWTVNQAGIPLGGNAAHFYDNLVLIQGFYSSGANLMKTIDQGVTGFLSNSTPAGEIIWAVWTEQDNSRRCFLLQNCEDPSIQFIFQEPPNFAGSPCNIDLSTYIGQSVVISFLGGTDPFGNNLNTCPAVADATTCWNVVQQVTCTGEPCIPIT